MAGEYQCPKCCAKMVHIPRSIFWKCTNKFCSLIQVDNNKTFNQKGQHNQMVLVQHCRKLADAIEKFHEAGGLDSNERYQKMIEALKEYKGEN